MRILAFAALCVACNKLPDLPPPLGDSDGKAPPPAGGGGGNHGDGGVSGDAGATALVVAHNPKAIALSGGYVYYTNYATGASDGTISRVATDGSGAGDVVAGLSSPWALAVTTGNVIYTTAPIAGTGGVFSVAESGGTVTPIQQNILGAVGLVADATNLYWTVDSSGIGIELVPIAGGTGKSIIDYGGALSPTALAISGSDLFIGSTGSQAAVLHGTTSGAGNATPLDTPTAENYADVAVSSTTVYAVVDEPSPAGAIVAFPRVGGPVTTVVGTLDHPGRLALDGTNLYFTDPSGGAVWRIDLTQTPVAVPIATALSTPLPLAIGDAIYVGASDAIVRIPK